MNIRGAHFWTLSTVAASLALAFLLGSSIAAADEEKPLGRNTRSKQSSKQSGANRAAAPSLDEQLLNDLDNDLLPAGEDAPRKPPRPAEKPAKEGEAKETDDAANAGEDLGESGDEDLIGRIGDKMREAERLIEQRKSPKRAEQLHEQITTDLAKLIEELQKQAQQQMGSKKQKKEQQTAQREQVKQPQQKPGESNPGSSNPARDSTDRERPNESRRPDMAQLNNLMKDVWGQLPEHEREQMAQTPFEHFLPKYELLIEKYYKRLAEQQKDR